MTPRNRDKGKLVLLDGTRFDGLVIGAGALPVWGEVVFNTSMTGYQEVVTDPSYAGQIVVMTYPQIGNYGVHDADNEREKTAARGLVVRDLSPFYSPGPGRRSLEDFMIRSGLCGLTDVDTRAITLRTRNEGTVVGVIGTAGTRDSDLVEIARAARDKIDRDLVGSVSSASIREFGGRGGRAAVVDFGAKDSIIMSVRRLGVETVVFGARGTPKGAFDADAIVKGGFDVVVLSNGPGDPKDVPGAVASARTLAGRLPILGICLGHQIAALALGGDTYKLKFGHRGANQPVLCRRSGRVHITCQNHGYAVSDSILDKNPRVRVTYSNLNDGTIEGFADDERLIECVQFHPEASPGPHDTSHIFEEFFSRVRARGALKTPAAPAAARTGAGDAGKI